MKTIVTRIPCRFPLEPKIKFYYKKKKTIEQAYAGMLKYDFSLAQTNLYL